MTRQIVCSKVDEGGLGIRSIRTMNITLLGKLLWSYFQEPLFKWSVAIRSKYLDDPSLIRIFIVVDLPFGSMLWNGMRKARSHILHLLKWVVGRGDKVHFWEDTWLTSTPLNQIDQFKCLELFLTPLRGEDYLEQGEVRDGQALQW